MSWRAIIEVEFPEAPSDLVRLEDGDGEADFSARALQRLRPALELLTALITGAHYHVVQAPVRQVVTPELPALVPIENSSNLAGIGYNDACQILLVQFQHDRTQAYRYDGVPAEIHAGLMAAESKGSFFAAHIKKAFPFTKVAITQ